MSSHANGIVQFRSAFDASTTIDKLRNAFESHGITVFAHIDFSGDAQRSGLTMRAEQMLIFGNPKAGTPLMQVEPLVGLDLPLKALVWDDEHGATWIACNTPEYILSRHRLPEALSANLSGPLAIIKSLAAN
ncbi:DUF302 domain-containing protein [Dyella sp. C11]|uniref:DUF302 domain-containing protein n=1 Tax=Dyella sp. C11 TaxID=2126991 RepID=UPI000D647693|nr:DUF302 domain-containing protein [Dyella sp. C11]